MSYLTKNGPEKTVHNALIYLNEQKGNQYDLFSIEYVHDLLSKYSYYRINEWDLESREESDNKFLVAVDGKTQNLFGMELKTKPVFVLEKKRKRWVIIDSYDLLIIDGYDIVGLKSDKEKVDLINEMKKNV